jgi:hypothetical protein
MRSPDLAPLVDGQRIRERPSREHTDAEAEDFFEVTTGIELHSGDRFYTVDLTAGRKEFCHAHDHPER